MQLTNEQRVLQLGVVTFCILVLLLFASFFQGGYTGSQRTNAHATLRFNSTAKPPVSLQPAAPVVAQLPHRNPENVLGCIFICITFKWRVTRLTALRQVLETVSEYPTQIDICVATDKPSRLARELERWDLPAVAACSQPKALTGLTLPAPDIAGIHWHHMFAALKSGGYSAFMHMESDVEVSWPALGAWAADNALLQPLGFARGFVRTEIAPWSGRTIAADAEALVNVSTYDKWVSVTDARNVSRHFVQLPFPCSGAWVATQLQLDRFISWQLVANNGSGRAVQQAEKAEAAANAILFMGPLPRGFNSSAVVPFDRSSARLLPTAHVQRVSNRRCGQWEREEEEGLFVNTRPLPGFAARKCTIEVDELLVL